ncbi:hypothetical protein BSR28_06970 [Boudabousia liubingyangii]|uniref:beta-glucosidase n=1 Tax=Boudabousia liubingyangii TaxID=1921764 RepID=UPI00093BFBAE|nr:glycoside hydrolase family 3 C-terminal domain-containing protein [Boudabousia liubingyangii]OKL46276.1 hypothetical protein BSR28_06970 [Boudabousia liubingyangii]
MTLASTGALLFSAQPALASGTIPESSPSSPANSLAETYSNTYIQAPTYQASAEEIKKWPWLDSSLTPEARAELLVNAMNEDQLIHMLHGYSSLTGIRLKPGGPPSIGYIRPIPELRVPALVMSDGPSGLRNGEPATALPAPITQAASFNRELAQEYGKTIAQDSADRGQDLIFGPGFNLARNPQAGRTFEYFGEDPFLSGTIAAHNVRGLQSAGIMATLKHYVANNQETNRTQNNSQMDQRTLHEIYEMPFRYAIRESQPAAVMCAYNKINGDTACGSKKTLVDDLRGLHKFGGFVVTDYPAAWSPLDIKNGLNVELPGGFWTSKAKIKRAVAKGQMTWDEIRGRVRETLTQMFRFGLFDHPWDEKLNDRQRDIKPVDAERGNQVAQRAVEEGAVLLKNDGILPLGKTFEGKPVKRVLVVGSGAKKPMSGGGSSNVTSPVSSDSAIDALAKRLGKDVQIDYKSQWDPVGIKKAAAKADYVLVFATQISTELIDRPNLDFLPHMNNAVKAAAAGNPNTVVVVQAGGPVLMPWLNDVRGVLDVFYPGQAAGEATVRLLTGEVNPSGRLPQTFPATNSQFPANTRAQFPGAKLGFEARYTEGIMMGYRWYTTMGQKPAFPFGYGLSYTTFEVSEPTLAASSGQADQPVTVSVQVKNTGERAGAVAPQVYVKKPSVRGIQTPVRELVAFDKVTLQPGESKTLTMKVDPMQLSVWNDSTKQYQVTPGKYRFVSGLNVEDVKGNATYTVR